MALVPFPIPGLSSLAPGALRYGLPPLALGLLLTPFSGPFGLALAALGLAALVFHRDPERDPPAEGFVAPADGSVSVVREEEGRIRVGVFMNVTDVHVNRAPAPATVADVEHRPGANRPAFSKESERNERVVFDCGEYQVALIAGWFARRIHPYLSDGDEVERGERIGHVSFGSRADVLFPEEVAFADLRVKEGDDVRAGETVLAVES